MEVAMKKPKMGDWVHFHVKDTLKDPLITMPALITSVINEAEGHVTMVAFHPDRGAILVHSGGRGVFYSEKPHSERWSWPPE
jgi:hypothetical protein